MSAMRVPAKSPYRFDSHPAVQLSLEIEPHDEPGRGPAPVGGRSRRKGAHNNGSSIEPILSMRDVVRVTGKHRATIYRWIDKGEFPAKTVPRHRPIGWLRSDIERWQRGLSGLARPCAGSADVREL